MFKLIRTEFTDEKTLVIHLSNAAQKDIFIQDFKPKLNAFLERRFMLNDFEIITEVDQSEENEILYSDEQKYNYLQSKFPNIKDLRKTFNLDYSN